MPDGDLARLELLDERKTDRIGALLVELGRIDAADVVRLEGLWLEHGGMLRARVRRAGACMGSQVMGKASPTLQRGGVAAQRARNRLSTGDPERATQRRPRRVELGAQAPLGRFYT